MGEFPLGLPEGSVRALIAIVLVGTCAFLWGTSQVVPAELLTLTGIAMTFYFMSRREQAVPAQPELPEPFLGEPA